MKTVKITYHCDYCKREIDPDSNIVKAVQPGKIGYQDQFQPDPEEKIQHYHDTCLEHILAMTYQAEEELKKLKDENTAPKPKPELNSPRAEKYNPHKDDYLGPVKKGTKDLGALKSFLEAGWPKDRIADEFGVSTATVYNWIKELGGGRAT